jgi:hypothetical protein
LITDDSYFKFSDLGGAMDRDNELKMVLQQTLKWNKARIACLALILQGLISSRTVNLTRIVDFFRSNAKRESSYRRVRRFFSEFSFDRKIIIPIVCALFDLRGKKLLLILDRTNWKWGRTNINILLISLAYQGIGIPIFWTVSNRDGASSTGERISALKEVLKQIGSRRIEAFLADREFIGEEWFRFLRKAKIPFVIRCKKNTLASGIQANCQVTLLELWKKRIKETTILNHAVVIWGELLYVSMCQKKGAKEPMIVVSNYKFEDPIGLYRKRWEIEVLFSCLKTRGFCMEDTHMTSPERIEKLLFVLAIAFCWSYKIGLTKHAEKPIPRKPHGRLSKSLFRVGLDWLRAIILFVDDKIEEFRKTFKCITNCMLKC